MSPTAQPISLARRHLLRSSTALSEKAQRLPLGSLPQQFDLSTVRLANRDAGAHSLPARSRDDSNRASSRSARWAPFPALAGLCYAPFDSDRLARPQPSPADFST